MRWVSRCTATSSASAKRRPTKIATGFRTSPAATGWKRWTTRCANFKDESFIGQYLSPRVMRDFRLFAIVDDEKAIRPSKCPPSTTRRVTALREAMSRQYDLGAREPNIQVWGVNLRGDRSLMLRHTQHNERPLHNNAYEVLKHVARLWGFPVHMESVACRA
jgi:stage V sporulation protein R